MDSSLIDNGTVQFGKTASDYADFRPGFPESFFTKLSQRGYVTRGLKSLDVGTGTGTLARGFAGLGCTSTGVDPSSRLMDEARRLSRESSLSVEFVYGTAEAIPFENDLFDLVTAGACWHWFRGDEAAAEIARVLKPSGRLIIANFDFQPKEGNLVQSTLDLIPMHNPEWTPQTRPDFFRSIPDRIETPSGFREVESYAYNELVEFTHESWRGRMRASSPIGASMSGPSQIKEFDDALTHFLTENYPEDILMVPHVITTRVYAAL